MCNVDQYNLFYFFLKQIKRDILFVLLSLIDIINIIIQSINPF